jgi:hypothetical protein
MEDRPDDPVFLPEAPRHRPFLLLASDGLTC